MRILMFSAILVVFVACQRESLRWDVNTAVPIAHGELVLNDVMNEQYFAEDEDGLLHLVLDEEVTSIDYQDLAAIPDTTVIRSFESPFSGSFTLPPGAGFLNIDEIVQFDAGDAELREVVSKSGELRYELKNYVNGAIDLTYVLEGITLDGEPVQLQALLPGEDASGPGLLTGTLPLAGYHFDLTGPEGNGWNTIATSLDAVLDESNMSDVTLTGEDSLSVWLEFIAPEVSYARGYFGQYTYTLDESITIDGADQVVITGLSLGTIESHLSLENYVGVDARIDLDQLDAANAPNGSTLSLESAELLDELNIARATDAGYDVLPTSYAFELSTSNSNVDALLEIAPDAIGLMGQVLINPLGDVSGGNDFIYTDRTLVARLQADMPLCIGLESLEFSDTLDLPDPDVPSMYGRIEIDITNETEFGGRFTLELIDGQGALLATLAESAELAPGQPGTGVLSQIDATVPESLRDQLESPNQLRAAVDFYTPEGDEVKVYGAQLLDIQVRAFATVEIGGQ